MVAPIVTQDEWHIELEQRRAAVWKITTQEACDLTLVYGSDGHAEPFRYLTNFTPVLGEMWALLLSSDKIACVLNFDWQIVEAQRASGITDWYGEFNLLPVLIDLLQHASARRVGIAGLDRIPATVYTALCSALPNVEFKDIGTAVTRLRRRKSNLEIALLREAGRITDMAFDAIRAELEPGLTEHEIAARLAYHMQSMGARLSFPPTVVSGNADPIMIRMPTERKLQMGDSVMLDIGAEVQGYQADATRTFVLGTPTAEQQKVWSVVIAAYYAALEQVRPGVPCLEAHRAAQTVINAAGYELVHRIGHGIGLATSFEWPSLITEETPFESGITICIEPGIYVRGAGNMKLEDDLVVTDDGYDLLTHSTHDIVIAD